MKLFIGVCSARDAKAGFVASLLGLWAYVAGKGVNGKPLEMFRLRHRENCSILSNGRQNLVTEAQEAGAGHLLFLDDDMTFPADAVDLLARHGKPVVGINYRQKVPGRQRGMAMGMDGKVLDSIGRTGIEPAGRMGLGVMLVDMAVFAAVSRPHFEIRWMEHSQTYRSDDYALCDLLREAGIEMVVDHELSMKCGHIGNYIYRLDGKE